MDQRARVGRTGARRSISPRRLFERSLGDGDTRNDGHSTGQKEFARLAYALATTSYRTADLSGRFERARRRAACVDEARRSEEPAARTVVVAAPRTADHGERKDRSDARNHRRAFSPRWMRFVGHLQSRTRRACDVDPLQNTTKHLSRCLARPMPERPRSFRTRRFPCGRSHSERDARGRRNTPVAQRRRKRSHLAPVLQALPAGSE